MADQQIEGELRIPLPKVYEVNTGLPYATPIFVDIRFESVQMVAHDIALHNRPSFYLHGS